MNEVTHFFLLYFGSHMYKINAYTHIRTTNMNEEV
jgi:hypothetical protein